jgi:GT2 family glycosyltransferase
LYLIDNSPSNSLEKLNDIDKRIIYIFNDRNIGFGAGHNIAITNAQKAGFQYHFVINPDIVFGGNVIEQMVQYMTSDKQIGMMMPEILYPNGEIQYLPKLLPGPFDIIFRKIKWPPKSYEKFINRYELRTVHAGQYYNVPVLSGCFTLLNVNAIRQIGFYDASYFMYFEDWDLSRRMHKRYKTLYFPMVAVYHEYEAGANKSLKLFMIFLQSVFTYFNKWGWFLDRERKQVNKRAVQEQISKHDF